MLPLPGKAGAKVLPVPGTVKEWMPSTVDFPFTATGGWSVVQRLKVMVDQETFVVLFPMVAMCALSCLLFVLPGRAADKDVGGKAARCLQAGGEESHGPQHGGIADPEYRLPVASVVMITAYRFHSGFLGATWVTFLVAKEGEYMEPHWQSMFMGMAKLIFGGTILLNPVFGLLGDRLALKNICGRKAFMSVGVLLAGIGICGCYFASNRRSTLLYFVFCAVWMSGEALVDTVTEALVPEFIPAPQHSLASSVRGLHFVLGGVAGCACIDLTAGTPSYYWLYQAYLALMVVVSAFTFIGMRGQVPIAGVLARLRPGGAEFTDMDLPEWTVWATMKEAYCGPMSYNGGFPRAMLCNFVFSLGTAPIFFTLLMVRDLAGIAGPAAQQVHFSRVSITFLLSAVVSSVLCAFVKSPAENDHDDTRDSLERPRQRWDVWQLLIGSMLTFGAACTAIPCTSIPFGCSSRLLVLYGVAGVQGFFFGAVYATFQTCMWSLLPAQADLANVMGLCALAKVSGCGLGNFLGGFILHQFQEPFDDGVIHVAGYAAMCACCAGVVLASAALLQELCASR